MGEGRLRPLDQRRVIEILKNNGFYLARSESHLTYKRSLPDGTVLTTWVPHHKEVSLFVIKLIIKQTQKPREEFY